MSDFIAKIIAEIDTRSAEKKIDNLTKKKRKIKLDIDDSKLNNIVKKTEKLNNKKIKVNTEVTGNENVNKLSGSFKEAEKSASSFGNSIKELAKVNIASEVFRQIEQSAKQAVSAVKEIDKAIVDLQMATGDSYTNVRQLVSGYNDFAKQLGATTTEVTSGASDWLRQGKSIADTNKLIKDSMVLSKVANIGEEESTSYLTAMMKGYKKSVEEVAEINDSLTSIDLAAAVDAGGLAEATSRVAASADLAGISLNRLLGYEAAVGEASQESMSVIGNSFKTIFSRMSDIKAGNLELIDEDGTTETLSDVETVLNNIGVQLRDSANEFRSFDDVLDDTAKRWDNLSSVQQAAVSKAFAGQRQANRFKLLMENYDTALEYEKIANKSSGTAMQKFNDAYLNSIESKQKSLQASFESLSMNLISRDSISGIMEATQALVEFLDKTNLLKGALAGFATGGILKGFVALTTSITQASMKMQNFHQAMSLLKAGNIGDAEIQKFSVLVDGLSSSQLKAIVSSKQLKEQLSQMKDAQRLTILSSMGMSEAQAQSTLSTMGLVTAEGTATASTISLGAAFKGLWSTLLANPIALITTGLTVGVTLWSLYNQSVQETIQRASEATSTWKDANSTLDEQIAKYKELKSQLNSGTLTPSEEYETRQQILDIQTQITEQYGQQASGIDLVNGSLQTQLGLLQQISAENAKQTLNENRKEYKATEKEMNRQRNYRLGDVTNAMSVDSSGKPSEFGKELRKIINSYDELKLMADDFGMYIDFTGNAEQADEVINKFMNDVEKASKLEGGNYASAILDSASDALVKNQEVLDDYQDSYKTFLQMDMLSKGTGKDSIADTFNKYAEAVEKYNDAIASGDADSIIKAREDFASLSSEVDNLLSKDGNAKYATLFDDITDQLNTAGVKAYDFQEALNGKTSGKNQFHKVSDDIQNASEKLKELKLDAVDALDALVTEGSQTGENELWTLAKAWGITAESSKEEMQAFIDVLSQAGIVSGEVGDSVEGVSKSFDSFSSMVQKAISDYETLKSIMSESVSGAGISADNVSAFRDMFGDDAEKALEKTANGYHLNKTALAELQAQMGEKTKAGYLSALSEQQEKLRDINEQIAKGMFLNQDVSNLETQRSEILSQIDSLQDLQIQYQAATSAYQQWQSAMSGGEEGDMYDSIYGNLEKVGDLYAKGLTGTNAFREFVDLMSNKDLSTASNEEIVSAYEEALPMVQRYFTEGQEGAQNFLTDIQNLNSEWAHMNEDGSWDLNFNDQEIADALNIDVEMVQAILKKLGDYGFEINIDQPISSLEELKAKAESANEALSNMNDGNFEGINLEASDFSNITEGINNVKEYIDTISDSELEPEVKTEKLEYANDILEYLVEKQNELMSSPLEFEISNSETLQSLADANERLKEMDATDIEFHFDTDDIEVLKSDIESAKTMLDQFKNEDGKVDLSIEGADDAVNVLSGLLNQKQQIEQPAIMRVDTSGIDGELGNIILKLQEFQAAVSALESANQLQMAGVDIDTSSIQAKVDSIVADIQNTSPDIQAKLNIDTSSADTISASLSALTPEVMVKAGVDKSAVDGYKPGDKNATVKYKVDSSTVDSWEAPSKSAVVNYSLGTVATPPSVTVKVNYDTSGKPKINGTAHAQGSAYAGGHWGLKRNENGALINEIGEELVVRDGEYFIVNNGYPALTNLKKDDIVFNHKQTEQILKNGYITGSHAKLALASGTAYSSGSGRFNVGRL